jgi:hypothetical protein
MLTTLDLEKIRQDIADLIGDNAVHITLRRGTQAIGQFRVRVERKGVFTIMASAEVEQTVTRYVLACDEKIDIRKGDRYNAHGFLFEVAAVTPRMVGVQADCYMVQ